MLGLVFLAALHGIGQPAPLFEVEKWLRAPRYEKAASDSSASASASSSRPDWSRHGRSVAVHAGPGLERGRLLVDLAQANADRGFEIVALCAEAEAEAARKEQDALGITGGVGVIGAEHAWKLEPGIVVVLGPTREVVWTGAIDDEKALLAAVASALERTRAVELDRPLHGDLTGALADYWEGRFDKARAAAEKLARKHEKAKEGEGLAIREDALRLVATVEEHERVLAAAVEDAIARRNTDDLAELDRILSTGFRGATAKMAEERVKEESARAMFAMNWVEARKWLELAEKRPVLFPVRGDGGGERFAGELEKFLKRSANFTLSQQRAKGLLERWDARRK